MKIPTHIFLDFRPNGPLRWTLQAIKTFARLHQWPKNLFPFEDNLTETMELIKDIKSRLIQRDFIKIKYIYIKYLTKEHQDEVKSNLMLENIEIVDYLTHSTHILKEDPQDEEGLNLEAGYLRTLDRKDDLSLVHWWYFPDSYDQWVENDVVNGEPDTSSNLNLRWIIHFSWLKHSKLFNEFMNPIDYEPDDEGQYDKIMEEIKKEIRENPSIQYQQITNGEKQNSTPTTPDHSPYGANGSHGAIGAHGDSKKRKRTDSEEDEEDYKRSKLNDNGDNYSKSNSIQEIGFLNDIQANLSESCKWFNLDDIHPIEKKEFEDFFDNSDPLRNSNIYKQYRNFIFRKFHSNPKSYLSATECRQFLIGDVTVIMRIHAFLENCGLINDGLTSKNTITRTTANILNQEFVPNGPGRTLISFSTPTTPSNSKQKSNITFSSNWALEESLRLFDGILRYGDDWDQVSKFVGTKTEKECIAHLSQISIEEEFYRDSGDAPRLNNTTQNVVPFADTSNPVMASVTFLASMVSPYVLSETTRAAQEALKKEDEMFKSNQESTTNSNHNELLTYNQDVNLESLDVRTTSAVTLGIAAARSKNISQNESQEIENIAQEILEKQLLKFEIKTQLMDRLINILDQERINLEIDRKRLGSMDESMDQ